MANRYPLVRVGGKTRQLEAGDNLQLPGALNDPTTVVVTASNGMDLMNRGSTTLRLDRTSFLQLDAFGAGTAGTRRTLFFNSPGWLVLMSNANLKLPGNTQISPDVGDVGEFLCEGGIVWRCLWYHRAAYLTTEKLPLTGGRMTGAIEFAGYAGITAADNLNIGAVNSNTVRIDSAGAVTINNFASATSGTRRILFFNTALVTLVHNSSVTILPGNANIVAGLGDHAEFACEGGSTWRCMWYQRRSGRALVESAVAISDDADNRLIAGTDGKLFVSDTLNPDPLMYYILARS